MPRPDNRGERVPTPPLSDGEFRLGLPVMDWGISVIVEPLGAAAGER